MLMLLLVELQYYYVIPSNFRLINTALFTRLQLNKLSFLIECRLEKNIIIFIYFRRVSFLSLMLCDTFIYNNTPTAWQLVLGFHTPSEYLHPPSFGLINFSTLCSFKNSLNSVDFSRFLTFSWLFHVLCLSRQLWVFCNLVVLLVLLCTCNPCSTDQ